MNRYVVVNGAKKQLSVGKKISRKQIVAAVAAALLVVGCVAIVLWIAPVLPKRPTDQVAPGYKGVVELWNVESFEGGSGSRSGWITSVASKYEQTQKGLFFHVTQMTAEQMSAKLADGQRFDMVCFSRGVGNRLLSLLSPLSTSAEVADNLLISAQIGDKTYANPLFKGGYCLFARQSQLSEEQLPQKCLQATYTRKLGKNTVELKPLVCGFAEFNSPLSALAMFGVKGNADVNYNLSQYRAYERFVDNKTAVCLLGTQRDLYRLSKREENGKIESLAFAPVKGYTDIVQYIGVSSDSGEKMSACKQFVEHLLSVEVQQSLVKISMFSVLSDGIYSDGRYAAMEQALVGAYVPNVFGDEKSLAEQRNAALTTLRS